MPFTTDSVDDPNSRYVQGGVTDVFPNRLGWWERSPPVFASDDIMITALNPKYNTRPDLLAYDLYGKAVLAWVVLWYNTIVDINEEFVTGATLRCPSSTQLYSSILTSQTGGSPVTTTPSS